MIFHEFLFWPIKIIEKLSGNFTRLLRFTYNIVFHFLFSLKAMHYRLYVLCYTGAFITNAIFAIIGKSLLRMVSITEVPQLLVKH